MKKTSLILIGIATAFLVGEFSIKVAQAREINWALPVVRSSEARPDTYADSGLPGVRKDAIGPREVEECQLGVNALTFDQISSGRCGQGGLKLQYDSPAGRNAGSSGFSQ